MTIQLSYAPSLTDPLRPIEFDDIEALARWLNDQPPVANKTDSAILVAASFDAYPINAGERTLDRATFTSAAFLDFDDGSVTADEVAQELEDAGLQFIIRPTFSSTPEAPRFVAIIPYDQPCPADKHRAAVDRILRPKLNGHAAFARESLVPVQPRFVSLKSGASADILLPEGFAVPLSFDPTTLPAVTASAQAFDPMAVLSLDPAERQLFRLALNYIDADAERTDWVAVLGCGMRMFGITPELLQSKKLSAEQWGLIADLEAFSARGSKNKYRKPENGIGIDRCTATRLNGDGEWVPSLVMQVGASCIRGTTMIELTGVIQRTDFFAFESELATDFPELLEQARDRYNFRLPEPVRLPTEQDLKAAALEGEVRVASFNEEIADYRQQIDTLFDRMPHGPSRKLAMTLATGGVEGRSTWFMQPPAATVLATQLINVIMANRVWVVLGENAPMSGNTYCYLFDDSGSGKTARITYAMDILKDAGYGYAHFDGKVHSAGGMHTTLMSRGQTLLMTADEVKSWFSNVTKDAPNSNQATLDAFMLRVWTAGCRNQSVVPDARAAERQGDRVNAAPPIKQPNISTFMIGVPDDMKLFSEGMLGDGSLARALCFVPSEDYTGETEEQRIRRMAKRRDESRRGNRGRPSAHTKADAAAALVAFDKALEQQGLGASYADVLAGAEFAEGENPHNGGLRIFREFAVARADLPDNMVRILTCSDEVLDIQGELDLQFALTFPGRKVEPIIQRYVEKSLRVALCLTMFDNPAAREIDPGHMRFALHLVALAEDPWLKGLLDAKQEIVLKGNKFERFVPDIKKLLDKGGLLYSKPSGFTMREIKNDKRFSALQSVVSKLNAASETIRRDAQTVLDGLNLSPIKNPDGKGSRIFHPDHRPELNDDDKHD